MIWETGLKILEPKSCVRIASPAKKKGFLDRLYDALFVIEKPEQKLATPPAPTPTPAPIPRIYGTVNTPGMITCWDGKKMTRTMVFRNETAMIWQALDVRIPASTDGVILGRYEAWEWNDMEEGEREDAIADWMKVNGLGALGIKAPEPDPQEAHARRMEKRAAADRLARQMLDHKRKLEEELKEAEEREQHYDGNQVYGAF
jgi:hypothetical protein